MILDIRGKLKPYYVQTLAMIFFPGVKFPEGEAPSPDTPEGTVILDEDEREVRAAVTLRAGGRETAGSAAVAWDSAHGDRDRIRKMAAGEAFMRAGEAMTGIRPPWGMLTGVRPAKVASELLDAGLSPEEAADAIAGEYGASIRKARLAVDVSLAERRVITPEVRRACSVYVGIPFCPTRCAYCSFVSYASPGLLKLIPEYLEALMADIDGVFGVIRETGMRVASAYIGGGTPTILSADQLRRLLSKIREHADGFREFTLEAGRPDTITKEKLAAAAEFGVTRVSVNTQTLNGDVLAKIGRAHTPGMFREAYAVARESGIRDINVDLIAGLPYDTAASFRETVDGVVALAPENITV
ncbi:MAG: radical SAM protein, partial [Clostridia bacterium]|nr:radical SAM protein [Clostridia bacterium]